MLTACRLSPAFSLIVEALRQITVEYFITLTHFHTILMLLV